MKPEVLLYLIKTVFVECRDGGLQNINNLTQND